MPQFEFSWVNEAPIVQVERKIANRKAAELRSNVKNWVEHYTPGKDRESRIPTQAQIDGTVTLCGLIESAMEGDAFLYEICGAPVAIMIVSQSKAYEHLDHIVTHPAADFAGSIMLERLLSLAAKAGREPTIRLMPLDANAKEAFAGLGFVADGDWHMKLVARDSPKWTEVGKNEWKFVSRRQPGPLYASTKPAKPG
jgi:hypothetical protein